MTRLVYILWAIPLVTEIDARRVGFLCRTMSCNNTVMNFLYDVFGRYELQFCWQNMTLQGFALLAGLGF